ncbi:MAG: hypothetical protein EA400_01095 [Chromatiaceae bacterium]|nr:MAG: hypothetical protein EA400_01095 [Chromatiaceae bacterium]
MAGRHARCPCCSIVRGPVAAACRGRGRPDLGLGSPWVVRCRLDGRYDQQIAQRSNARRTDNLFRGDDIAAQADALCAQHDLSEADRGRVCRVCPGRGLRHGLTVAERTRRGISDGMIRPSIGREDSPDLIADLHQALAG